jgi:hypothetical protein
MAFITTSYVAKVNTVFGDQRVVMGLVSVSAAGSFNVGNFKKCNYYAITDASCNTGGIKSITSGATAGAVHIASCTAGDQFRFIVIGK